ncbi:MAG: fumarylacetoacetate hydrolase family protein [Synoicihabitans sp.]
MGSIYRLYPSASCIVIEHEGAFTQANPDFTLDLLFSSPQPLEAVIKAMEHGQPTDAPGAPWPLVQSQEVWAAGVTYYRSRTARMEESQDAGGGDFYDRVYDADRPELFLKATPHRVAAPKGGVRIRSDSKWNVPEPELTLAINTAGKIFGYTLGNDMSSRDIEGENPLYLPQAKCYDRSAALGPCLVVSDELPDPASELSIEIKRRGERVFHGATSLDQIKRSLPSLADWLYRENVFPFGAYLMTGTGIVPPDEFTLNPGDQIHITLDPVGTLTNMVVT